MTPAESWRERFWKLHPFEDILGVNAGLTDFTKVESFIAQELKAAVGAVMLEKTDIGEDHTSCCGFKNAELTEKQQGWDEAVESLESAKAKVLKNLGIDV